MGNASEPTRRAILSATAAAGAYFVIGPASACAAQPGEGDENAIRAFRIDVPEEALVDLRRRLAATRWPDKEIVDDQSQGVQLATMQKLVDYWQHGYDWRKTEARLNGLPQFITKIDGIDIILHSRSFQT